MNRVHDQISEGAKRMTLDAGERETFWVSRRTAVALAGLAIATFLLCWAQGAKAAGQPVWEVRSESYPTHFTPGGTAEFIVSLRNVGDAPSSGQFTVTETLPAGWTIGSTLGTLGGPGGWTCTISSPSVTCTSGAQLGAKPGEPVIGPTGGSSPVIQVNVQVPPSASGTLPTEATVSGGGAASASSQGRIVVDPTPAAFGIDAPSLFAKAYKSNGDWETGAGSHPYAATANFQLNSTMSAPGFVGQLKPVDSLREATVDLPPGFVGNPRAVPQCAANLLGRNGAAALCPPTTQVGVATLGFLSLGNKPLEQGPYPVYNLDPGSSEPGLFGFNYSGNLITVHGSVRSDGDYGLTVNTTNISQNLPILWTRVTFWGAPADPSHDAQRFQLGKSWLSFGALPTGASGIVPGQPVRPFLTNPTECQQTPLTVLKVRSWKNATDSATAPAPPPTTGCDQVEFDPSATFTPTTNLADSPSGLEVNLHLPQNEDPAGRATSTLKKTVVQLPAGLTVNPSSADGLGACSPAQIGMTTAPGATPVHFDKAADSCPDSSRLGNVEVATPLLAEPLKGSVYLATQNDNPFSSLLALYIVVEGPGVIIKLPGKVVPDERTGQLTAVFDENPKLPFEDLDLEFFGGPRASLKTPLACGSFSTTTTLTPWSAPDGPGATRASSFEIARGAGDSDCIDGEGVAPNKPAFTAGTADPTAAAYAPFGLRLARADGSQRLRSIDTTLPPGLVGKLAGLSYCPDSSLAAAAGRPGKDEQASPSCPGSSRVGSVTVGAGVGSSPIYVGGTAYLAGPYKGAPLSLAIVTPAVAGPFDLGTVVVRTALYVDPVTTRIRAVSDEIPSMLQGIPLEVRSVSLQADRPQFTLNPTSCNPMKIEGSATSVLGQSASLENAFQVGGCQDLGFKPSLAIRLKGGTKRAKYQQLTATLTARPGDANIGRASVALPHSEFLAQEHIKTICTRVQYAANQCPAGSVYGTATAVTPLLDKPLEGSVYLRSSSNPLPDMVVALRGQIDVDLVGRIDSVRGGIRTTFETVPDAPVSKFTLRMQGGKKSLLVNSRDLCKSVNKATVEMDGQNGKTYDTKPVVTNSCRKKAKKKVKGGKGKHRGAKSHKKG